ncbi:hypothetical protein BDZ89DRAFT_1077315 [Hymenopellis radicata]|nr:hypothetical protein BDZ89DRAFT_1077315 [Hymenopellis radicata]
MASRRRARKTEDAIFSGYDMSPQAFMDMVGQMPALRARMEDSFDLESCRSAYLFWAENHGAPKFIPLYEREVHESDNDKVSSFFLPTRFIDYTGKSQLNDVVNAPFAQETEKDKARLADFARRIHDDGGAPPLDITKFSFHWVQNYHPYYSFLTGTWLR